MSESARSGRDRAARVAAETRHRDRLGQLVEMLRAAGAAGRRRRVGEGAAVVATNRAGRGTAPVINRAGKGTAPAMNMSEESAATPIARRLAASVTFVSHSRLRCSALSAATNGVLEKGPV